ncbi:hypothetical protein [Bradyrhizobium ganzhouense]|uniref:hypothetical protein n=1 Tax=Bradyrhizobium ganzhouense TaxID=1179767 RepID=UPI003CEFD87A
MQKSLSRESSSQRIFPNIDPALYRDAPTEISGQKLLALAKSEMSWLQRYAGFLLSPKTRLARLFMLHRLGFEAELSGEFVRADFFWREAAHGLRSAWPHLDTWQEGCALLEDQAPASPEALRNHVVDELFIDTHMAFANGRFGSETSPGTDDRAFAHLAFLRALLDIKGMPASEQTRLLAPGIEAEITAFRAGKKWDAAIDRASLLSTSNAEDADLQDRVALLHFGHAIDGMSGETDELAKASWLGRKIDVLDRFRLEHPDKTIAYELLGQLYHLQSIRLANGGRLADALVAGRKAQLFGPGIHDVEQTMSQLFEAMNQLQAQVRDVNEQLRRSGNMRLNEKGLRMKSEAERGFGPLELYVKSGELEQVTAARYRASARKLWADIGLPQTPQPSEETLAKLLDVVGGVYASQAMDVEQIATSFRDAASSTPAIAHLAEFADRVGAFVVRRRLENAGEAKSEQEGASGGAVPADAAPASALPTTPAVARPRLEPLRYWLFGTQDRGYRALAAVAAFAAIAVLIVAGEDWRGSTTRAQAYQAIVTAQGAEPEKIVIPEAQRFFSAWTLQANDARDAQVKTLLREAQEAPNRRIRDNAFEQLRLALQREDNETALDAAEHFLGAPPLQIADPRRQAVLRAYARVFTAWFADLPEPVGEAPQARISNYRKFATAAANGGTRP